MSTDKRQLVWDALNNRETERVPVGFWFHFASEQEFYKGLEDEAIVRKNIDGHLKFYEAFKPDFVKLMSDGFFRLPERSYRERQIRARSRLGQADRRRPSLDSKNRSPSRRTLTSKIRFRSVHVLQYFRTRHDASSFCSETADDGNRAFADSDRRRFESRSPRARRHRERSFDVLAERVIAESGADGIYLSVQNVQDIRISIRQLYRSVIAPSEKAVLRAANRAGESALAGEI